LKDVYPQKGQRKGDEEVKKGTGFVGKVKAHVGK